MTFRALPFSLSLSFRPLSLTSYVAQMDAYCRDGLFLVLDALDKTRFFKESAASSSGSDNLYTRLALDVRSRRFSFFPFLSLSLTHDSLLSEVQRNLRLAA